MGHKLFLFFALLVAAASANVVVLTPENFDSVVLDSSKNVFVKFFAPWCGHCIHFAPTWEKFSNEVGGDVVIAELDATKYRSIAKQYGVKGYPTLKFFPKGNKAGLSFNQKREMDILKAYVEKFSH
eukprot:GILI01036936.1.p1 GENE.GILI01036936.1~~GILI01036936.1.p1  ORF type:complete len:126 (+),score=16.41 GILI01036936.1:62-439(+)